MKATPPPSPLDILLAAFGTSVQEVSARTTIPATRLRHIYLSGKIHQREVQCVLNAFGKAAYHLLRAMQIGGINQAGSGNIQLMHIENMTVQVTLPPMADRLASEEQTKAFGHSPQRWSAYSTPGGYSPQIGQHSDFHKPGRAA